MEIDQEEKREQMLNDSTECWWRVEARCELGLQELLSCPIRKMVRAHHKRKEEERLNCESGLL